MNRRSFLRRSAAALPLFTWAPLLADEDRQGGRERAADLVIVGGGLGGCAAALAACGAGLRVILTEPTDWIGGQLTSQASDAPALIGNSARPSALTIATTIR